MKKVIILRGIPGGGKSTLAKQYMDMDDKNTIIHSTDNYHIKDGVYKFDAEKLGYYHRLNEQAFMESVDKGIETIIVDNTNINPRAMRLYIDYAKKHDYSVMVKLIYPYNIEECVKRNVHNVPEQTVRSMAKLLIQNADYCENVDDFASDNKELQEKVHKKMGYKNKGM